MPVSVEGDLPQLILSIDTNFECEIVVHINIVELRIFI
jgi:hypothetical protein